MGWAPCCAPRPSPLLESSGHGHGLLLGRCQVRHLGGQLTPQRSVHGTWASAPYREHLRQVSSSAGASSSSVPAYSALRSDYCMQKRNP